MSRLLGSLAIAQAKFTIFVSSRSAFNTGVLLEITFGVVLCCTVLIAFVFTHITNISLDTLLFRIFVVTSVSWTFWWTVSCAFIRFDTSTSWSAPAWLAGCWSNVTYSTVFKSYFVDKFCFRLNRSYFVDKLFTQLRYMGLAVMLEVARIWWCIWITLVHDHSCWIFWVKTIIEWIWVGLIMVCSNTIGIKVLQISNFKCKIVIGRNIITVSILAFSHLELASLIWRPVNLTFFFQELEQQHLFLRTCWQQH